MREGRVVQAGTVERGLARARRRRGGALPRLRHGPRRATPARLVLEAGGAEDPHGRWRCGVRRSGWPSTGRCTGRWSRPAPPPSWCGWWSPSTGVGEVNAVADAARPRAAAPGVGHARSHWWSISPGLPVSADPTRRGTRHRLRRHETARLCPACRSGHRDGSCRRCRQPSARRGAQGPGRFAGPVVGPAADDGARRVPHRRGPSRRCGDRADGCGRSRRRRSRSSTSTGPASGSRSWSSAWCPSTSPTSATGTSRTSCRWCTAPRPTTTPLHQIDKFLIFGHEPAIVLHSVLGETSAAHVLAIVYLLFLPISPLSLIVYLVWSRNISCGYWYATAQCLAWMFGTISYYALPTLGPNFAFPLLYKDLDETGVTTLLDSLWYCAPGRDSGAADDRLDPERRGLRVPARRHHLDARAGHALHRPARLAALVDVGVLRADGALDALLRLALHLRRHRRRRASPAVGVARRASPPGRSSRSTGGRRTRPPRPRACTPRPTTKAGDSCPTERAGSPTGSSGISPDSCCAGGRLRRRLEVRGRDPGGSPVPAGPVPVQIVSQPPNGTGSLVPPQPPNGAGPFFFPRPPGPARARALAHVCPGQAASAP